MNYWPYIFQTNRVFSVSRRRLPLAGAGRRLRWPSWLLGVILVAVGYPARPALSEPVFSVQLVFESLHCGGEGARVQWLDDRSAVARVLGRIRHDRTRLSRVLRRLDFTRQGVVMIRVGTPPSIESALAQTKARVIDDALRIRLSWREPRPGGKGAQTATRPCLLAAVPRGSYKAVTVVDTSEAVYGCTDVPERRPVLCEERAAGSAIEPAATKLRHRQQ